MAASRLESAGGSVSSVGSTSLQQSDRPSCSDDLQISSDASTSAHYVDHAGCSDDVQNDRTSPVAHVRFHDNVIVKQISRLSMVEIVGDWRDSDNPNFYMLAVARINREEQVIESCPRTYLVAKLLLTAWRRTFQRARHLRDAAGSSTDEAGAASASASAGGSSLPAADDDELVEMYESFEAWMVAGRREACKQSRREAARSAKQQRHGPREGRAHLTRRLVAQDSG